LVQSLVRRAVEIITVELIPPNPDDLPPLAVRHGRSVDRKLGPIYFMTVQVEVLAPPVARWTPLTPTRPDDKKLLIRRKRAHDTVEVIPTVLWATSKSNNSEGGGGLGAGTEASGPAPSGPHCTQPLAVASDTRGLRALNPDEPKKSSPRRSGLLPSPRMARRSTLTAWLVVAGAYGSIAGQLVIRTENHILSRTNNPGSGSAAMVGRASTKMPYI
jgi:hypothetical protein